MRRVLAAALFAAGCTSQWYEGPSTRDSVTTNVVVHTEPEGAVIVVNDVQQRANSPIRIPVRYDHFATTWERQTNAGQQMRAEMGPVMKILTCPVWLVASVFHEKEEILRHTYEGNVLTVTALMPGRDQADATVTLKGEAETSLTLTLVPSK
jgi:hypothetical protein